MDAVGSVVRQGRKEKRSAAALRMILACVLAWLGLAWAPCSRGLNPALDVSQYAHTAWRASDGFTKGQITAIAQTPDGYLWLGTEFGLYRFDGVRTVPWQPRGGVQLPSSNIKNLLVSRDGTLWIATLKGLASWKDSKLTQYVEVAGQVGPLLQDRGDTVWVGGSQPAKLCAIKGGGVQCHEESRLGQWIAGLYEDHNGSLWVASETGVWRWAPGIPECHIPPRGVYVFSFIEDDEGALLLGTNNGLKRLIHGKIQSLTLSGVTEQLTQLQFFRSSEGSLWVTTEHGLLHLHQGRTDTFGSADGLSGDRVTRILEDREGSVWVTTQSGLDRFRDYTFPTISTRQGLSSSNPSAVWATRDGSIWVGGTNGLSRWKSGEETTSKKQFPQIRVSQNDARGVGVRGGVSQTLNSALSWDVQTLAQDDQGRLWVATGKGVFYFEADRLLLAPGVPGPGVWAMVGDGHDKMWISNGTKGLFRFASGDAVQQIPWSRLGQTHLGARALLPNRSEGGVWLGFYDGGIAYFKDGQIRASYTSADGLGKGIVNDLRFGADGELWASTENGLSRIKDGRVVTLTSKNGLPCDAAHWSAEDDDHIVWILQPCGLTRIARSELAAWVGDPTRRLKPTIFDSFDGVRSIGLYGSFGPHVTKSPDGKIWFLALDSVTWIDTRHLFYNNVRPPVYIEQIKADGKAYDAGFFERGALQLPPQVRDLTIDYTALSLAVPEKVHFRFKLEGQDKDWREVVNERHVQYSNLAPKNYRFRVAACNNSGVWNEEGASLDFSIAPAYYQTNWFRALCVAGFLALLWALYELRLRGIQREFNAGLEERLKERTRIARELHDTLLQNLHGLLFRFQAARNMLPRRPDEAMEALDGAISRTEQAITESQDAITDLRPGTTTESDLGELMRASGKELEAAGNGNGTVPSFTLIVEGERKALSPILQAEVYRIARELLRNSFRHACARRVESEIRYGDEQLRVRIRDDGKGMDPEVLKKGRRPGHWGLLGVKERAEQIGAKLDFWSEPGAGTEVQLIVPAAIAYKNAHGRPRFRFLRRVKVDE